MIVQDPSTINAAFAEAFNSRQLSNLLALYEDDAVLRVDGSGESARGKSAIAACLSELLKVPGRMISTNNFCVIHGGLALLRADWSLIGDDGTVIAAGSTAEIARQQKDGHWLYAIDHAAGASLPRIA